MATVNTHAYICVFTLKLMNNGGRRKQKTSKTTIPYSTHLLLPVVVPGVTVGIKMLCLQKHNKQFSIVRTYCHHYGPSHGAWKMRRQSYDTDGVSHVTLWLRNCYSMVCCTSSNIHTALVSPSTVGYPVPSHSGS